MDSVPVAGGLRSERGFASLQFVVAASLALLLVVALAQLLAYQYARGAAMTALERGVRAGSLVGAGADRCREVVDDSLGEVLGGAIGDSLEVACRDDGEVMTASASGMVPAWVVGGPGLAFEVRTLARKEVPP